MPDRVLVTGAGGYVGRHVVRSLLDRGHEVVATVRPSSRAEVDLRATIVAADILAPDFDVNTLSDTPFDGVVHLAWQDGFAHNAPSHMEQLSSHFRFLEALTDWGVGRLAVLGTMHEVGYWEGAIDADTPTNPLSLYGIAKDALRRASFVHLAPRVPLQWLRCYYILGDDLNNQSIFTRILTAAAEGKTTFPFTTGKNRYDFIDVSELGDQIATVSARSDVTGIINCSSGVPLTLAERVETFITDNNLPITLEYGAFPDRPYDSPGVWGDASQILAIMADEPAK
ncbi:nucleoside-diphosphate-sugar epimerase [Microbacteriaceae bacterium SG_E_30_P1]|uniref:Nucleoside-diphosphate-sugar epimerase n=1 Tax=Antiquaquibacter oligotrophicus TaxID=2880260 RepID=A0ABT6KS56_9MICO|nr:NAD(P)-dependent oxidoreductase [Antiquaquibacter oligotrophicus]MDH6182042.1 nucleoside-diphosphate-sugar epimerase [Antiquaquibacter oligotrophicus]UDF12290.1 NAD(P)-dependent oxidoreductase [Antiquaquibacter oligotrophicus]